MKRAFIALFAAVIIAVMIAGCANRPGGGAGAPAALPTPGEAGVDEVTSVTLFIDHTWFWIDSFGGRLVDDEITRRTGITFDVTRATDGTQLQILLAAGSFPDVVYTGTQSMWPALANQHVSYDWGTLAERYNIYLHAKPIEISNATQADGYFYTIYNAYSPPDVWMTHPRMLVSNGSATLHVRQDIMEALGNPPLRTLEDFRAILSMVNEQFPEMQGLVLGDNLYGLPYFRWGFHGQTGDTRLWWDEDEQRVRYRLEDPGEILALQYLNSLFRAGYIRPESLIYQLEQFRQSAFSGNVFAVVRSTSESNGINTAFEQAGIDGRFVPVRYILTGEGFESIRVNDGIGWSGTYITRNNANPGKTLNALAYLRSPEGQLLTQFGIYGETFTFDEEGFPRITPEVQAVRSESHTLMVDTFGLACWSFGISAVMEAVFNWNPQDPYIMGVLQYQTEKVQFRPWFQFVLPSPGTDLRDTFNIVGRLLDDGVFRLISAESEQAFQDEYDRLMRSLFETGLGEVLDFATERFPYVIALYD